MSKLKHEHENQTMDQTTENMSAKITTKHRKWKRWQKVVSALACIVVFCTTYALILPAITLEKDTYCGIEAHEHTEECYVEEKELVCGIEAQEGHHHEASCYDADKNLICGLDEVEGHEHIDACYAVNNELKCDKDEHKHSLACESNLAADMENAQLWEKSLPTETELQAMTNHEKVVAIAKSQLGYTESSVNYICVDADSNQIAGCTRYGSWYNTKKSASDTRDYTYSDWSSLFAAFCLDYSSINLTEVDWNIDYNLWISGIMQNHPELLENVNTYEPIVGDLIFLYLEESNNYSVGIVTSISDRNIGLIRGDVTRGDKDYVIEESISLNDDSLVFYLVTPEMKISDEKSDNSEIVENDLNDILSGEESLNKDTVNEAEIEGNWVEDNFDAMAGVQKLNAMMSAYMSPHSKGIMLLSGGTDSALNITNGNYYIAANGVKVLWHEPHNADNTGILPWKELPKEGTIPADAHLRIEVKYANVDPAELAAKNYQIEFLPDNRIKDLMASGNIKVGGEVRGSISASTDRIVLTFDPSWVNKLAEDNTKITNASNKNTIYGDFYFQGELDLSKLDQSGSNTLHLGPVNLTVPLEDDAVARYGKVDFEKQMDTQVVQVGNKYFLKYLLKVKAGEYGSPNVVVRDTLQQSTFLEKNPTPFVGVTNVPTDVATTGSSYSRPIEKVISGVANQTGKVSYEMREGNTPSGYPNAGSDLVWEIGNMTANEERTLEYCVEISSSYIGSKHTQEADFIVNEAALTSNGHPKDTDLEEFVPKVDLNITKDRTQLTDNHNGTFTATYRVKIEAPSSNSYPLTNLKFTDDFGDRTWDAYGAGVVNNIHYNKDSLTLKDGNNNVISYSGLNNGNNPVWRSTTKNNVDQNNANIFDLYIGDMNPGDIRYVEYTMQINADACKSVTNGEIGIRNRAEVWDDPTKHNGKSESLGYKDKDTVVDNQYWDRKVSPGQLSNELIVNTQGADGYYQATRTYDSSKERLDTVAPVDSFTVPAGAFKYTVIVNESGQWNVTQAELFDELTKDSNNRVYLQYAGYVQVDVYDKLTSTNGNGQENPLAGSNNNGVLTAIQNKTPKATYWVKVDPDAGGVYQSFGYKPSQIYTPSELGLDGKEAYVLTYYAVPSADAANANKINAGNQFNLSGTVIGDGGTITLQPMRSTYSVTFVGGVNYSVNKYPWHYEAPKADEPTVNRYAYNEMVLQERENYGSVYFAFEYEGSKIFENFVIRDETQSTSYIANQAKSYALSTNPDSYVGVYIGNLGEENGQPKRIDTVENMAAFQILVDNGEMQPLVKDIDYCTYKPTSAEAMGQTLNRSTDIKFLRDISIPSGKKVYIIVKCHLTYPLPENAGATFNNYFYYKASPEDVNLTPIGQFTAYNHSGASGGIKKDAGNVFQVSENGTKFEVFDRTQNKYITDANINIIRNKDNGERYKQELQNSLLVVASSAEDAWAAYDGKNGNRSDGTYQYWKDQVLNYTYQDGLYVTWQITLNPDKNRSGAYSVIDNLPSGVELCYVRTYGGATQGNYPIKVTKPVRAGDFNVKIQITGNSDKYLDWAEHVVIAPQKNGGEAANWLTTYTNYYTKGNQIAFYIPNLIQNSSPVLQIVCRVTDPKVYFEDVEFYNEASLYNRFDKNVATSGESVWARSNSISKSDLSKLNPDEWYSNGNLTNPTLPYRIEVNADKLDMDETSDVMTIPLIDFMSSNLSMDMSTLRIYSDQEDVAHLLYSGEIVQKKDGNGQLLFFDADGNETTVDTGKAVLVAVANTTDKTEIRVSSETGTHQLKDDAGNVTDTVAGTSVKFHNLPDKTHLIITYNVSATLKTDGTANKYSNSAYWDGHENVQGGETAESNMIFEAGASAGANSHGGLEIVKHDGSDESIHLSGAKFALYRAQYECYQDTNIPVVYDYDGTTEHKLTFEQYEDNLIESVRDTVNRDREYSFKKDTSIDEYEYYWVKDDDPSVVITAWGNARLEHLGYTITFRTLYYSIDGTESNIELVNYDYYKQNIVVTKQFNQQAGHTYRHNILRDTEGKAICEENPIGPETIKYTDNNGLITYGLTNGEDAIHFNKVYCVKELEAPEGYELDSTEYFFVVPNDNLQFQDGVTNFFYRNEWPTNVHVVTRMEGTTPTYFLDVFNYKGKASVTKDFGGTGFGAKPGSYTFAIYSEQEGGNPVESSRIGEPLTLTYTEDDFTITTDPLTNQKVYTLKETAKQNKYVTFDGLSFGHSYFIYELNDAGIPIQNAYTGTVNEETYYVTYSVSGVNGTRTDGTTMLPNEVIPSKTVQEDHTSEVIVPIVIATNNTYAATVTKKFKDLSGTDAEHGIAGIYKFGLWQEYMIDSNTGLPKTDPYRTVEIEWKGGADNSPQKQAYFNGLQPGQSYYIFEMNSITNEAVKSGGIVTENGMKFVVSYEGQIKITVNADDETLQNVTVANQATVSLPHTGAIGTRLYTLSGAILIAIALAGYCIYLMRRKRERGIK